MTHPERSAGVRALIEWLAERVLACNPGARIERSNLETPETSP